MKKILTIKKKLFSFFVLMFFLITNIATAQNQNIKITDLNLNRIAESLVGDKKNEFPKAENGFLWNLEDAKTKKWQPQGITGVTVDNKEFVIVSWYGRPQFTEDPLTHKKTIPTGTSMDYSDRGARISIVNITKLTQEPSQPNYRNILLIDQNHETYHGMKASSIVAINGKLHVTDTRKGKNVIRVFDLNKIQYLPEAKAVKSYRYILVEEYNYKTPIQPSFIAYDKDKKQILVGTSPQQLSDITPNLIGWFTPPTASTAAAFTKNIHQISVFKIPNQYKNIQGIASSKDANNKQILWISTSSVKSERSIFYKMNIETSSSGATITNASSMKYPSGLKDVYWSATEKLWLLTVFPLDKTLINPTRRVVFCIKKENILP